MDPFENQPKHKNTNNSTPLKIISSPKHTSIPGLHKNLCRSASGNCSPSCSLHVLIILQTTIYYNVLICCKLFRSLIRKDLWKEVMLRKQNIIPQSSKSSYKQTHETTKKNSLMHPFETCQKQQNTHNSNPLKIITEPQHTNLAENSHLGSSGAYKTVVLTQRLEQKAGPCMQITTANRHLGSSGAYKTAVLPQRLDQKVAPCIQITTANKDLGSSGAYKTAVLPERLEQKAPPLHANHNSKQTPR